MGPRLPGPGGGRPTTECRPDSPRLRFSMTATAPRAARLREGRRWRRSTSVLRSSRRRLRTGMPAVAVTHRGLPHPRRAAGTGVLGSVRPSLIGRSPGGVLTVRAVSSRIPSMERRKPWTGPPVFTTVLPNHPDYPLVTIAAGFSGQGFKFVPVVGEILATCASPATPRVRSQSSPPPPLCRRPRNAPVGGVSGVSNFRMILCLWTFVVLELRQSRSFSPDWLRRGCRGARWR